MGISKKRTADVAWVLTDSLINFHFASQIPYIVPKDSVAKTGYSYFFLNHPQSPEIAPLAFPFIKWKMRTAVGGGPVLLQNGEIKITNNEELKFAGKAIDDKHPRTAMGYTKRQQARNSTSPGPVSGDCRRCNTYSGSATIKRYRLL